MSTGMTGRCSRCGWRNRECQCTSDPQLVARYYFGPDPSSDPPRATPPPVQRVPVPKAVKPEPAISGSARGAYAKLRERRSSR